jgi:hypothetical protein
MNPKNGKKVLGSCKYVFLSRSTMDEILAEWLEHLTAKAKVATILGSIPASSDTVESEVRQMKQC